MNAGTCRTNLSVLHPLKKTKFVNKETMKNNPKIVVGAVFIIGLLVTSLVTLELYNQETDKVLAGFKNHTNEYGAIIDKEVRVNFEVLHLLKSHFERQEVVTPKEFDLISGDILERYPDIQALEWIPKVANSERLTFEEEMKETFLRFEIRERKKQGVMVRAESRPYYYPVTFVKPVKGNEAAIGFDLGSNESRLEALKKSEFTKDLVATSSITLVQGGSTEKGFLAFLPVYGDKIDIALDSERELEGFVLGVYRFGSLFEHTGYKEYLKGINMIMLDLSDKSGDNSLYSYVYKDEKIKKNRLYERVIENIGGRSWSLNSYPTSEYFLTHRQGRHVPVFFIGLVISYLLAYLYYIYISRKKSEKLLYKSRERVNSLLDSTAEAIFGLDLDGKCTFVNASCLRMLKYDNRDELIGKDMQYLVAQGDSLPDDRVNEYKFHESVYDKGVVHFDESIFWRKDNTCIPVEYWAHPIREKGVITGAVVTFFDVTHRKILEKEAIKAQKLESLGLIAGGIAHDFNNLLTTIMGNISLANMQVDKSSELASFLADSEKASERARELTSQLLTFSKVKMDSQKIFSVEEVLQESRRIALRGSNIINSIVVDGNMPLMYGDEGQLSQVFNNIMINAKQAMHRGGLLKIKCNTVFMDSENPYHLMKGEYIKIKFIDEGSGISEEHMSQIFDPYFTTKETGSGLGLATSYSIIKNHKGSILVDSVESKGTTVTLLLPSTNKTKTDKYLDEENLISFYGTEKILIMDDDDDICEFIYQMLTKVGYDVTTTRDGDEAIAEYRYADENSSPFDLVIMDLTIKGGRGGKETMGILKSMFPHIKTIVSSGYSDDPIMANYGEYGFRAAVSKPYKTKDMLKMVKEVIEG